MTQQRHIGQVAEEIACQYLQAEGLTLLTRNFHSRYGEIDLILLHNQPDGHYLCFVEVKARHVRSYVTAAESIAQAKQAKIIQTAHVYLQKYPEYQHLFCRFDAFTLDYRNLDFLNWTLPQVLNDSLIQLQWIKDAYTL